MRHTAPVTIRDVAVAAGVTPSTVSRALNDEPRIAPSTRARILEVAGNLGYSPSRAARALRTVRTQTLGLFAPDLGNPISQTFMHAAVGAAYELGYAVFACDGQGSPTLQQALLRRLLEHRVDGILVGYGQLYLTQALIEAVRSDCPVEPEIELPESIQPDETVIVTPNRRRAELERGASTEAYQALLAAGHRRLTFVQVAGPEGLSAMGKIRRETYEHTLADAGLPADATRYLTVPSADHCASEIEDLLSGDDRPTAIVSAMNLATPAILRGIYAAGMRMPNDLSFLSFGDSEWAASYAPPIAVIRHDYALGARAAVQCLIERAEGQATFPEMELAPSEFMPRGSIGPAPTTAS